MRISRIGLIHPESDLTTPRIKWYAYVAYSNVKIFPLGLFSPKQFNFVGMEAFKSLTSFCKEVLSFSFAI